MDGDAPKRLPGPAWSSDANETKPVVTERRSDVPDESAAAGSAGSSSDEAATTEPSSHGGPFPVDIGDDGRQLVDEAGPRVAIGDAGWSSLTALDEEEVEYYFEQLANLGYNAVLVNVIETEFTDHPPEDAVGEPTVRRGSLLCPNQIPTTGRTGRLRRPSCATRCVASNVRRVPRSHRRGRSR